MRSVIVSLVAAALASGCGSKTEAPPSSAQASVTAPQPAASGDSCEATLRCYAECNDEPCRAACDSKAAPSAAMLGRSTLQCIANSGCSDQDCATKACAAELERCVNGTVAAGEAAPTAPAPGSSGLDGVYKKPPGSTDGGPSMKFTVSGGGTRITDFSGTITGSCGGTGSTRLSSYVSSMSVAADGSFSGTETLSESTTEVSGTLSSDGTASGTVKVRVSGCVGGPRAWITARL